MDSKFWIVRWKSEHSWNVSFVFLFLRIYIWICWINKRKVRIKITWWKRKITVYSKSWWIEIKIAVSSSVQVFMVKIDKPHKLLAASNFRALAYSSNMLGILAKPHFRQYGTNCIFSVAFWINIQKSVTAINFLIKRTSVFTWREQSRLGTVWQFLLSDFLIQVCLSLLPFPFRSVMG